MKQEREMTTIHRSVDGRSQPRKPHVVMWMTRLLRVNGHRSSEFSFPYRFREWSRADSSASSITVVVRRVPFVQTWSSIFVITGCAINQPRIDVKEVNPNFVMARLICTLDAKRIVRNFEGTMHANMPHSLGPNSPATPPGPHSGVGPCGIGKHVLAKASSVVLLGRCTHCLTAAAMWRHVNLFLKHYSTNCKKHFFFANPTFRIGC